MNTLLRMYRWRSAGTSVRSPPAPLELMGQKIGSLLRPALVPRLDVDGGGAGCVARRVLSGFAWAISGCWARLVTAPGACGLGM